MALLPAYASARWGGMAPADALGGEVKADFERELRVRVVICGVSRCIHNPPVHSDGNIDEGEGKNRVGELLSRWPAGRIFGEGLDYKQKKSGKALDDFPMRS
jgi:hypothetical protein